MKRPAVLLVFALLGACQTVGADEYPSLAVRDAERVTGTLPPPPPYVPPPQTQAVTDDLGRLAADVASAQRTFADATPAARNAVNAARGSGPDSETWAIAQVALAGLESARSRAMIALADLDRLYVAAATEGTELSRIAAARDAAVGTVEEQNSTISALLAALG